MESQQTNQEVVEEEKIQSQFTEREMKLAEKYSVKPECVRRLDALGLEWTESALQEAVSFWPDTDNLEIKPDEWTGEKALENKSDFNVIEKNIMQWFNALDFKAKLACTALCNLSNADNRQEHLTNAIYEQFENEVTEYIKKPSQELTKEDLMILGVTYEVLCINR